MKRNNRIIALVLTLACVIGIVSAASWDLNGDGKTNVWDLQQAADKTEEEKAEALKEVLGGSGDELHPNSEGKYEIWTELGLYHLVENKDAGASYVLMADIDLGGRTWQPIANFKGHLDGNNKTISGVTITAETGTNVGFFAQLDRYTVDGAEVQSVVENLNLRDVNITVTDEKTQYIGLLTGSNRGIIRNCTTTGAITDTRTTFGDKVYVGTLTGRNNNHDTMPGAVESGTNTMTVTTGSPNSEDKVTGITSQLAFFPADNTAIVYETGIAGYSAVALTGMLWQDTTGSVDYQNQVLQERRQGAVDAMYQQGTVQWTTSETLYYTVAGNKTSTHSNAYRAGTTYVGVPYNSCSNSYEMFLSQMQAEKDSQGRYVTVTGLEDGVKTADNVSTGFIEYMGNDCSAAVAWSWGAISPARVANNGVRVNTTPGMVPNKYNTDTHGVLAVGDYETLPSNTEKYSSYIDARDTRTLIELNGGAAGMAEYYAKASRGDALLFVEYTLDEATDTWVKGGGHARMLAYDPMIIRDWDGDIDLNKSYVITHEQGDGLYDNRNILGMYDYYNGYQVKQTSWRTDYKYTLATLLTKEGYDAVTRPGCGYGYVPVTIAVFHDDSKLRAPYLDAGYTSEENYHPVVLPNSGWYYCNYMVGAMKMTIQDADGNTIYEKLSHQPYTCRGTIFQTAKLEILFPDATENLVEGQTYYETLEYMTADGQWYTQLNNKAFTYTSTEQLN